MNCIDEGVHVSIADGAVGGDKVDKNETVVFTLIRVKHGGKDRGFAIYAVNKVGTVGVRNRGALGIARRAGWGERRRMKCGDSNDGIGVPCVW